MAETTTSTNRKRKPSTTQAKTTSVNKDTESAAEQIVKQEPQKVVVNEIDLNQYITVRNGFQGKLVYKSKRTNEKFVWDTFGDEQEMELRELRNAKSSSKGFFINNWFEFDEDSQWVVDYLGVSQYYKNALSIDNFDEIYSKSPKEIEETVAALSSGQKKSVAYRARQLIADGTIDSNKAIAALEKALGTELIER